jgi:hypothetical protein
MLHEQGKDRDKLLLCELQWSAEFTFLNKENNLLDCGRCKGI